MRHKYQRRLSKVKVKIASSFHEHASTYARFINVGILKNMRADLQMRVNEDGNIALLILDTVTDFFIDLIFSVFVWMQFSSYEFDEVIWSQRSVDIKMFCI